MRKMYLLLLALFCIGITTIHAQVSHSKRYSQVSPPSQLQAILNDTDVTCYGANNGEAEIIASGTPPNITYLWEPGGQTTSSVTGLSVGTYTAIVSNGALTLPPFIFTITQPNPMGISITGATSVSCHGGNDGTAKVNVTGGTQPYTYLWSPIGGTKATGTGLTAGTYTVTVTDANDCSSTSIATIAITQPTAPITTTISGNSGVKCFGGTETATVNASGGTPPYTYLWSPTGGTNATGTGLTAGTYTITVTDQNGCNPTSPVTLVITQPATAVNVSASISSSISCNGFNNGKATISPSGGVPPYTYSWAPAGGNNATATGLSAGTYTVTVTDKNGCTGTAATYTVVLTQPTLVTVSASVSSAISCNGFNNGKATISPSGGVPPYTYSWAPTGGNNATATGLSAGTYTVTITDKNGCTGTAATYTVVLTQPTLVTVSASVSSAITCNGYNNGIATISPSGGVTPYTYSWTPTGGTNATATGLSAGTYTVTVTDQNGCTGSASTYTVVLTQPTAVKATVNINLGISCFGGNENATITVTGGTSPYTYSWSPTGGTNSTGTGLSAGTYTVTITDHNGCTTTSATTVAVTQPTMAVSATSNVSSSIKCNGETGSITLTTTGGTSPYTYLWSPTGGTDATATRLSAGTYTITITDNNGCHPTTSVIVTITQPAAIIPNMTISSQVSCFGGDNGTVTLNPSGGTTPYTYSWSPTGGTNSTGTGLSAGTYTVTITDHNGCTTTSATTVVLTQPLSSVTTSSSISTPISCKGYNDGSITVNVSGGTTPYTYSWSPTGGTNATGTGLSAGTYTITITDKNGCGPSTSTIATITEPATFTAAIAAVQTTLCPDDSTTIQVTTSGGSGQLTYLWNNGETTSSIIATDSLTTTYTVTGSGVCGTYTLTQTITRYPISSMTACCNTKILRGDDTTLTVIGSSGIQTYQWIDSATLNCGTCTTVIASPTVTTTYTVTGTDAFGCKVVKTLTIIVEVPCYSITIPTVFTPTYAGVLGVDNKFYIKTKNIDTWSLHVYDRWGVELFNSTNPYQYWDGRTESGNAEPAGVYYYIITASCQATKYKKDGYIQLIR